MTNNDKNSMPIERRKIPRSQDTLFRTIVALNILVWSIMVIALVVFHQGRPELVTGFNKYLGISAREQWIQEYYDWLIILLQSSLGLSLLLVFLRKKRSRRKSDDFGFNLFFLLFISTVSLATLLL